MATAIILINPTHPTSGKCRNEQDSRCGYTRKIVSPLYRGGAFSLIVVFHSEQSVVAWTQIISRIDLIGAPLHDDLFANAKIRRSADAPDIDGQVFIEDARGLSIGEFVEVKIIAAEEHDLWGERVTHTL